MLDIEAYRGSGAVIEWATVRLLKKHGYEGTRVVRRAFAGTQSVKSRHRTKCGPLKGSDPFVHPRRGATLEVVRSFSAPQTRFE